jgi:YcaO-like protein with predicted kinase domain
MTRSLVNSQELNNASAAPSILRRIEPVAREIGVTRLANITHLDTLGFPVWTAIRPDSRGLSVSQGKGVADEDAKVGALMESIECWHAEQSMDGLVYESPARLGTDALDPAVLAAVPHVRFSPDEPMLWVHSTGMLTGRTKLVPWLAVSLNLVGKRTTGQILRTSTGLAGGSTVESAAVHAVCELAEREAASHWLASPDALAPTRLLRRPSTRGQLKRFLEIAEAFCDVGLWDITSPVSGLPTFACILLDRIESHWFQIGACSGYACDLDPERAALKALLEAAQARATVISGSRDDLDHAQFERSRDVAFNTRLREAMRRPGQLDMVPASLKSTDPPTTLNLILSMLDSRAVNDVYRVDLTQSRFDIPVVKLLSPEMIYRGLTHATSAAQSCSLGPHASR